MGLGSAKGGQRGGQGRPGKPGGGRGGRAGGGGGRGGTSGCQKEMSTKTARGLVYGILISKTQWQLSGSRHPRIRVGAA